MKRLLLFAAVAALSASCVDKSFDLSDITTDDIQIGSENSVFQLPLANITVMWSGINGTYDSLDDIFAEADTWIPKSRTELVLADLADDKKVDEIISELMVEIKSDSNKKAEVIERIKKNSDYAKSIESHIPTDNNGRPLYSIDDYINQHFELFERDSREALREIVDNHLESLTTCISEVESEVDGFGLDDEIIDLLTGNNGSLRIYGDLTDLLPVDGNGDFRLTVRADYGPDDDPDYWPDDDFYRSAEAEEILSFPLTFNYNSTEPIDIPVTERNLRGMKDDMMLTVSFNPTKYHPRTKLPDEAARDTAPALKLNLKLEKKGALSLGSILGGDDE